VNSTSAAGRTRSGWTCSCHTGRERRRRSSWSDRARSWRRRAQISVAIPRFARVRARTQVHPARSAPPPGLFAVSEGDLNPHPVNPDEALNVATVAHPVACTPLSQLESGARPCRWLLSVETDAVDSQSDSHSRRRRRVIVTHDFGQRPIAAAPTIGLPLDAATPASSPPILECAVFAPNVARDRQGAHGDCRTDRELAVVTAALAADMIRRRPGCDDTFAHSVSPAGQGRLTVAAVRHLRPLAGWSSATPSVPELPVRRGL
jgi:hypothetical protein